MRTIEKLTRYREALQRYYASLKRGGTAPPKPEPAYFELDSRLELTMAQKIHDDITHQNARSAEKSTVAQQGTFNRIQHHLRLY